MICKSTFDWFLIDKMEIEKTEEWNSKCTSIKI